MNDNLHIETSSLEYLDDNAYYDDIGEDRDGLGGFRGWLSAAAGAALLVIIAIELMAFMALFG